MAEFADGTRDQRMERRRGGEADRNAAGFAARSAAGADLGLLGLRQDRLGVGKEGAAGVGQRHAARMALEQRDLDLAFQGADLLRQRRLLHAELLGGTGDMAFVGHSDEVAEMAQFHRYISEIWKGERSYMTDGMWRPLGSRLDGG
jgi:hypothetical protein